MAAARRSALAPATHARSRARHACTVFVQHAGAPFQSNVIAYRPRAMWPVCRCARIGRPLFVTLPFLPFPPARSDRTGKMRAFVARPGCQTVRAPAADRALQLYRPSYPRYYNPPIAGQ